MASRQTAQWLPLWPQSCGLKDELVCEAGIWSSHSHLLMSAAAGWGESGTYCLLADLMTRKFKCVGRH